MAPALTDKRILIVEDERAILELITDMLAAMGIPAPITAATLSEGLAQAGTAALDLALLDVNLAGRTSFPIAERLDARGIPFVFVTGYGRPKVDPWNSWLTVFKPFPQAGLKAAMEWALQHGGRLPSPPQDEGGSFASI